MPIGDLLASITGESPKATPAISKLVSPAPKRKAEDDLRGSAAKKPPPSATGSYRPTGDSPRPSPRLPDRSAGVINGRSGLVSKPAISSSNLLAKRPLSTSSRAGVNYVSTNGSKQVVARTTTRPPVPAGPPKKGSFQEIMARAQAAQEARKNFGRIQHKTVERGMTMKERKDMKTQDPRSVRKGAAQTPQKSDRGVVSRNGSGSANVPRNGNGVSSASKFNSVSKGKKFSPSDAEIKKVKKAATATTGYTGTARPRAPAATKPGSTAPPSSDPKAQSRPRYPAALSNHRRRYDEEEDDGLDDFIEYDDEEDEPGYGRRGSFDSLDEDESDMEAGMSDIDQEERRADYFARSEDKQQEELEKKLKREKEERKRQYMKGGGR